MVSQRKERKTYLAYLGARKLQLYSDKEKQNKTKLYHHISPISHHSHTRYPRRT